MASFNDSKCAAGGVCPTDPLLFTCELKEVFVLRVVLPNGYQEIISFGDIAADIALPAGFIVEVLEITIINDFTRNISLALTIVNASLLDGGEMRCDDTTQRHVMAGCPLLGKFEKEELLLCTEMPQGSPVYKTNTSPGLCTMYMNVYNYSLHDIELAGP